MNPLCRYPLTFVKRRKIKKQVVETTCGSHEKTSGDSLYEARGSCPPENIISPGKKVITIDQDKVNTFLR
jgi:hypothetical protein